MTLENPKHRWVGGLSLIAVSLTSAALLSPFSEPPTDPQYAPACGPVPPCTVPPGQWNLRSDTRTTLATNKPGGISVDLAWSLSVGRPDVSAVVMDSGVNYDHVDLRNQIWLNRGELPAPNGAACVSPRPDAYDCNNDGVFNMLDYTGDSRITDAILPGDLTRSDLKVFEDGVDSDGNGYVDDISGYDMDDGDPDEYDHRDFGHGTGRNGFIVAEPNNGQGIAGICPNCRIANIRMDDTYVCRTEGTALGVIWAADNGHELVTMALGHTSSSSMSRAAFDYAYRKNTLAMSAIANEFHFHQGLVGVYDDVMAIGAVTYDTSGSPTSAAPATYVRKANFSNFGAHLEVVAPTDSLTTSHGSDNDNDSFAKSTGTSSAVPHAVGVAALIISRARDRIASGDLDDSGLALQDLSAQEVRQILNRTADDVIPSDDTAGYAVTAGWDKYTGYGRINAKKALDRVDSGKIPPEADINSPDWYTYNLPGVVAVQFYANNRWSGGYTWKLEVGDGLEPSSFTEISSGASSADQALSSANMANTHSVNWTTPAVTAFTAFTLRLTVTDNADAANTGEDRMAFYVRPADPQDHPGWPKRLVNGALPISAESFSTALVDLDNDNKLEIIVAGSGDGKVFAFHEDGAPVTGFPVMTNPPIGLPSPLAASDAFDGNAANGEVPITGASTLGGPAVGDIDRDGIQDICVGAYDGRVYCWNASGVMKPGFPVSVDLGQTRSQYPPNAFTNNLRGEAIIASLVLRNLDGDAAGTLEIVTVAMDQKLYAWHADGSRVVNFPVPMFDAALGDPSVQKAPKGAVATPVVANIDGDAAGTMEIVAGTNEGSGGATDGTGRVYAFSATGTLLPGWPVTPNSLAPDSLPIVAQGVGTSPVAANVDGGNDLEIMAMTFLGDPTLYKSDGTEVRSLVGTAGTGTASDTNEETPAGGAGGPATDDPSHGYVGNAAFGDLGSNGSLEYFNGSIGNGLVLNTVQGDGSVTNFEFYLSGWTASTGATATGYPRVLEGWQFFTAPVIADLSGDNVRDVAITSSGNFLHVFDNSGAEVTPGWPKRTGHWSVGTPSVGDIDDDGDLELVVADRLGYINVWDTPGAPCSADWRKFHHDEWNTGDYTADTLRPAKVSDLVLTQSGSQVQAVFTAVGDDGRCGNAASYRILVSGQPVADLPVPKAAGMQESLTFTGNAGGPLELSVLDEAGNASPPVLVGTGGGTGGDGGGGGRGGGRGGALPLAALSVLVAALGLRLRRSFRIRHE